MHHHLKNILEFVVTEIVLFKVTPESLFLSFINVLRSPTLFVAIKQSTKKENFYLLLIKIQEICLLNSL